MVEGGWGRAGLYGDGYIFRRSMANVRPSGAQARRMGNKHYKTTLGFSVRRAVNSHSLLIDRGRLGWRHCVSREPLKISFTLQSAMISCEHILTLIALGHREGLVYKPTVVDDVPKLALVCRLPCNCHGWNAIVELCRVVAIRWVSRT